MLTQNRRFTVSMTMTMVAALAACGPHEAAPGRPDGATTSDGSGSGSEPGTCNNMLSIKVRDFHTSHPDFEHFTSDALTLGLVEPMLGADGTPTYKPAGPTVCTTGPSQFADWYHDVPDRNVPITRVVTLVEDSTGQFVFDSPDFFPIDNAGFGNEGMAHNFAFTTEIHTSFTYTGGEVLTFHGDDDIWLFINGRLAIDLGGLHQTATATVDLDAMATQLGIAIGSDYKMDIFQAERHSSKSDIRIETTINCFIIL